MNAVHTEGDVVHVLVFCLKGEPRAYYGRRRDVGFFEWKHY
jgi:hypothetical protein